MYDKGVPVFYERFRSTVRCSYSVKIDLKYFYEFRQKAFAPARQDMLGRVENSFNYSSVDSDMASKSFNVCGITLMHSMKVCSALLLLYYLTTTLLLFFLPSMHEKSNSKILNGYGTRRRTLQVFPPYFLQTYKLAPKTFWISVLNLLPHCCKISRLCLVLVANYWI